MIRKFSASWVYTLRTPPLKNGIVAVDENGQIVDITDTGGELREMERLEYHSGIISPGFVNAHCHLELSHLMGKIPEQTGMAGFLAEINSLRVFSTLSDITLLRENRSLEDIFLVLCPNSNLFIGNGLPPVELFRSEGMNICIGTDSLASNHQLSVLAELITLQQYVPGLQLEEMLTWACLNGARALQMEDRLGTLEVGKRPGLLLINGIDLVGHRLTLNSRVKRLV